MPDDGQNDHDEIDVMVNENDDMKNDENDAKNDENERKMNAPDGGVHCVDFQSCYYHVPHEGGVKQCIPKYCGM